jgi:hypothetical protein
LLSKDRNPNTNGARLILGSSSAPGAKLVNIASAVRAGAIKGLVILKENAMHPGTVGGRTRSTARPGRDEYIA